MNISIVREPDTDGTSCVQVQFAFPPVSPEPESYDDIAYPNEYKHKWIHATKFDERGGDYHIFAAWERYVDCGRRTVEQRDHRNHDSFARDAQRATRMMKRRYAQFATHFRPKDRPLYILQFVVVSNGHVVGYRLLPYWDVVTARIMWRTVRDALEDGSYGSTAIADAGASYGDAVVATAAFFRENYVDPAYRLLSADPLAEKWVAKWRAEQEKSERVRTGLSLQRAAEMEKLAEAERMAEQHIRQHFKSVKRTKTENGYRVGAFDVQKDTKEWIVSIEIGEDIFAVGGSPRLADSTLLAAMFDSLGQWMHNVKPHPSSPLMRQGFALRCAWNSPDGKWTAIQSLLRI